MESELSAIFPAKLMDLTPGYLCSVMSPSEEIHKLCETDR